MARLRQAVIAATDLDAVAAERKAKLGLKDPYSDPQVAHFGLRNVVFALGDTFLEVVSPAQEGTAAGRFLERRGGDGGYMLMFQVDDVAGARARAKELEIREVFDVKTAEIEEAHLHPADMRGAIVSISQPEPRGSWPWGGPDWPERSAVLQVAGATVGVADAPTVTERWGHILDGWPADAGVTLADDPGESGLTEIVIAVTAPRDPVEVAGVRFRFF
jgi:hypothetical protein